MDLEQVYGGSVFVYPNYMRAIQGHKDVDARWLDARELTEAVTGEVYHLTDLKNIPSIKRNGVTPGGPDSKREMVHLSAGHPVRGHKAQPGRPIPNNYAYWGGNDVKDDRPNPVIITLDVKMLRERNVVLLQTESYVVLSKRVLPPECIIRIEDMDGKRSLQQKARA